MLKSGAAIALYLNSQPYTARGKGGDLSPAVRHPKLVVLESTTYPGTTDTDLREVLEAGSGLKAGVDFHLVF